MVGREPSVNLIVFSSQFQNPNYTPADLCDLITAVSLGIKKTIHSPKSPPCSLTVRLGDWSGTVE